MAERGSTDRQAERKGVTLKARCRTMSGIRDEGLLTDISTHGCCLITRGLLFNVGGRVMIRPDGIEAITGVVRWIHGNKAGIQFDQPLYGPMIDHVAQANSAAVGEAPESLPDRADRP